MYRLGTSFVLCWLATAVLSYNIDIQSPYVVKVQSSQENSLFGFSTALHIHNDQKYILVGAPRANWTSGAGSDLASPGAVYKCPLSDSIGNPTQEETCSEQITYLTDNNAANDAMEDKANQWLGVNVQSSDLHITACAHRYVSIEGEDNDKRMPIGKCTVIGSSMMAGGDGVEKKTLYPCRLNSGLNLDSGSCQVGSSQVQYRDDDKSYLLYGAPGVDIWEGSAYLAESLDDVKFFKKIDKMDPGPRDFNQYNGYAVAICKMSGDNHPLDFVTAAPRANNYLGMLYFFVSDNTNTNERTLLRNSRMNDQLTGDQMGAYFGYSMACGDLDGDGTDDLLVSAPWYSKITSAKSSIVSVGRVYVYYGDQNKVVSNADKPAIIEAPYTTTSAFGLGMAHIGDVNKDGYQDFAIGAPFENDYQGAVYIYHGSRNGIKKTPVQSIYPSKLGNSLGVNLKSFGWSISANKDMDGNEYPDMAIGSYMSDRVVYLRSLPIVDLDIEIRIPSDPVDLLDVNKQVPGSSQMFPGTTLQICFRTLKQSSARYEVNYEVELDYKQNYAPRAFFQESASQPIEFKKEGTKEINLSSSVVQCTDEWTVFLKKKDQIFDEQTYIEVNMTANIKESDDIASRAVLKQEQVTAAKGRIVIKSICTSDTGICQCDVNLKEPSVTYLPAGYDSIVLDNVNQVIVKYEVENLGPDNAHVPTLVLELPPKVTFIRRTPVDDQTEADVSQIACSEIEANDKNYVMCFLQDPLPEEPSKFGIKLDTMSLTDTEEITLTANVKIGSPSEEKASKLTNNERSITLKVGKQANLEIRGTSATDSNSIRPDLALLEGDAFLRSIKLEVRHTVSVLIKESEKKDGDEEGITDIVVEISWPMKDHEGNYLLYLSEVYVKDNQIKDNFVVSSNEIDPDCLFDYNADCKKKPTAYAVSDDTEMSAEDLEKAANAAVLNTNCSIPDTPGCVTFNVTINLLKAGSINMKDLEFEMRSIIWLPNVINRGDFNATSTAKIVSVGQNLVIPPGSSVEMRTRVFEETEEERDVLWIIVGSVIGGVAILAILIVVLWKVGFFKRKMPPRDGSGSM